MFYVKTKLSDECEINTEITDENVFTRCAECGAEIHIDLGELAGNCGELDLFGTAVFCDKCSK